MNRLMSRDVVFLEEHSHWRSVELSSLHILTIDCCSFMDLSDGNSGLCWTVLAWDRDTAVPAKGNGDLQTLICVLVARPRRCLTVSNCRILSPNKTERRLISATLCVEYAAFVADQLWLTTRIREEEEWRCIGLFGIATLCYHTLSYKMFIMLMRFHFPIFSILFHTLW